ncbi:MAG: hypothetical protein H6623_07085 [Bdellovibrionaceae bacterium]|nr:hypothetical protein [Pseudobdellovibrionaceae bacterium]
MRAVVVGLYLLFVFPVYAGENLYEYASCLEQLNQMNLPTTHYTSTSGGSHFIFKKGAQIDGSPAGKGFFRLKNNSVVFCSVNWPQNQSFEFQYEGEAVSTAGMANTTGTRKNMMATPKNCKAATDAGTVYFKNQIHAMVEKAATKTIIKNDNMDWEYPTEKNLRAALKACLNIDSIGTAIKNGLEARKANGPQDTGGDIETKK